MGNMMKLKQTTPFCNNPKCDLHKHQVAPSIGQLKVVAPSIIVGHMGAKFVTRNLFTSADGKRKAFFCEVCESAINTAQLAVGEVEPK